MDGHVYSNKLCRHYLTVADDTGRCHDQLEKSVIYIISGSSFEHVYPLGISMVDDVKLEVNTHGWESSMKIC